MTYKENKTIRTRPCGCNNGEIVEELFRGVWINIYSIWSGGIDFGEYERLPCCKKCEDKQHDRICCELGDRMY
ncbi:MAG: hypothetical protein GY853_05655 [PVC group bacterium]|nr:hypothetical protein [PVC group bacterium]